jgi:hypothetical protein
MLTMTQTHHIRYLAFHKGKSYRSIAGKPDAILKQLRSMLRKMTGTMNLKREKRKLPNLILLSQLLMNGWKMT